MRENVRFILIQPKVITQRGGVVWIGWWLHFTIEFSDSHFLQFLPVWMQVTIQAIIHSSL